LLAHRLVAGHIVDLLRCNKASAWAFQRAGPRRPAARANSRLAQTAVSAYHWVPFSENCA